MHRSQKPYAKANIYQYLASCPLNNPEHRQVVIIIIIIISLIIYQTKFQQTCVSLPQNFATW